MSHQDSIDEGRDLRRRVDRLGGMARDRAKAWKRLGTLVDRLTGADDLKDLAKVRKVIGALRKVELEQARELAGALEAHVGRERRERRFRVLGEVIEAFRASGIEPRPLGGDPPGLRVDDLVVFLDGRRDRARIEYARQAVAEAPLVADRVVEAWDEARSSLVDRSIEPETFREALLGAYRARLAWSGGTFGERVDAVDLLPEVAMAVQDERFRADPRGKLFSDYGRAQFAHDLAALVEAGMLADDGLRMEMGPATMGSTARKRRVLWLEVGPGGGQYYLSLRFVAEEGAGQ